jgi:hypothetical protein
VKRNIPTINVATVTVSCSERPFWCSVGRSELEEARLDGESRSTIDMMEYEIVRTRNPYRNLCRDLGVGKHSNYWPDGLLSKEAL